MSGKVLGGGRCGKEGEYIITIYKRDSDGAVVCKVKRVKR